MLHWKIPPGYRADLRRLHPVIFAILQPSETSNERQFPSSHMSYFHRHRESRNEKQTAET